MDSTFGDMNEPQSAAFGPQQHKKLFFNRQTLRWEPIEAQDEPLYDKTFAGNTARGTFRTLGTVGATGPDTSTEAERTILSPQGEPDFYGGAGSGLGGAESGGSLEGLRAILQAELRKARGY